MITVVIPALNEEKSIRASVLSVINTIGMSGDQSPDVILVNDGSTDRTGEICDQLAKEFPFVRAIHHVTNTGQGSAILDGIRLAKYDRITMFPGDNAVTPYTLRNLFANRDKADYVLAMIINVEYRSARRMLLSAIFSHIYTTTFRIPIRYINAPGLWPVSMLRKMDLRGKRYSLHGEINVKLLRQPISFLEVDGYMKTTALKSSAIRFKNILEVTYSYLRLCFEIFVTKREQYSFRAKRVLPPNALDA